jgi:integrase
LGAVKGHIGRDTGENYRYDLQDFLDRHTRLAVAAINRELVRAWLDAERPRAWGVSSHRGAITALKRPLNWAVEAQLLVHNPIDKLKKPKARRRKKVMDAAERADILSLWPEGDPFRDFLVAIQESGCRPGEVMKVTAAAADLAAGIWVLRGTDFETTGELRTIYLTPALSELTRRLAARHPTGPLFRKPPAG